MDRKKDMITYVSSTYGFDKEMTIKIVEAYFEVSPVLTSIDDLCKLLTTPKSTKEMQVALREVINKLD